MSVEYALRSALDGLDASNEAVRTKSMNELRKILSDSRVPSQLDNKAWKAILDKFCVYATNEKAVYLQKVFPAGERVSTATPGMISKRLKAIAQVAQDFRLLCELVQDRQDTFISKILIEHILQTLPEEEGLFKPLAPLYTRSLRTLLTHVSHRDHLTLRTWKGLMWLCSKALGGTEVKGPKGLSTSPNAPVARNEPAYTECVEFSRIFSVLVISCPRNLYSYVAAWNDDQPGLLDILLSFFKKHPLETPCHLPLLASLNHILWETSHNCVDATWDTLAEMALPLVFLLEKTKSSPLKLQILHVLRFYARCRENDVEEGTESEDDWRHFIAQLYDVVLKQLGSKSGIGCLSSAHVFIAAVQSDTQLRMSIVPLLTENSSLYHDAVDKDLPSWAFLDLASESFLHMMRHELHEGSSVPMESEESSERFADSPRPRKRHKRSDICADIRHRLSTGSVSRDEKSGMLQTLAFLFEKHGRRVTSRHRSTLLAAVMDSFSIEDSEIHKWAFVCLRALARTQQQNWEVGLEGGGAWTWTRVWELAARHVGSGGVAEDAAYLLLEMLLSRCLVPESNMRPGRVDILESSMAAKTTISSSAARFLTQYFRSFGKECLEGTQDTSAERIFSWLCSQFTGRRSFSLGKGDDIPSPQTLAEIGAALCACEVPQRTTATVASSLVHPANILEKEEFYAEWRLQEATTIYLAVLDEDLSTLTGPRDFPQTPGTDSDSSPWQTISESNVVRILVAHAKNIIDGSSDIEMSERPATPRPATPNNKDVEAASLAAMTYSVAAIAHVTRVLALYHENFHQQVEKASLGEYMDILLAKIARELHQAWSQSRPFQLALEHLISCFSCWETSFTGLSEPRTITRHVLADCKQSVQHFHRRWPFSNDRVSDLLVAASEAMRPFSRCSTPLTPTTTKRASTFDDFDFGVSPSRPKPATVSVAGLQLDFFRTSAEASAGTRTKLLCVRLVKTIFEALFGNEVYNQTVQEQIVNFFIDALQATEYSRAVSLEVVEWMTVASRTLTADQCLDLLCQTTDLLSVYEHEKNPWAWSLCFRSLRALLPAILAHSENQELEGIVKRILGFFTKKLTTGGRDDSQESGSDLNTDSLPWRVCLELAAFSIQYLKLEPNQDYMDKIQHPVMDVVLAFLRHEEFIVRMFVAQSYPQVFTVFPDDDHPAIFKDVQNALISRSFEDIPEAPKMRRSRLLTDALTFGEVAILSPRQRQVALVCLLEIASSDDDYNIAEGAMDAVGRGLKFGSGKALVEELLPRFVYAWSKSIETFPFRILGSETFGEFLDAEADAILPRMLVKGELKNIMSLVAAYQQDLGKLLKRVFPWALIAEEAVAFLKHHLGVDYNKELRRAAPVVVGHMLELVWDAPESFSAKDVGEYASIESAMRRMLSLVFKAVKQSPASPKNFDTEPSFRRRTVLKAIKHLKDSYGPSAGSGAGAEAELSSAPFLQPQELQRTLQSYHATLESQAFIQERKRLLGNGYALLIALSSPAMSHPYLFRTMAWTLIKNVRQYETCVECCGMLAYLCQQVTPEVLCANLAAMAPALAEIAVDYQKQGRTAPAMVVGKLVNDILAIGARIDEGTVRLAVLQLDEDIEMLRGIKERYGVAAGFLSIDLANRLMALRTSTAATRLAVVKYLRKCLENKQVVDKMCGDVHLVGELIARLLEVGRAPAVSEALAVEVGRCLGRMAPFCKGRLIEPASPHSTKKGDVRTNADGTRAYEGHIMALQRLQVYAAEPDLTLVDAAVKTLRAVLTTQEGLRAFEDLDRDTAAHIDIFKGKPSHNPKRIRTQESYSDSLGSSVWTSQNTSADETKRYEKWVVNLANTILSSCKTDPVLQNLGLMFEHRHSFAETMLPYIIHTALWQEIRASSDGIQTARPLQRILSEEFGKFFTRAAVEHHKAVQTLLSVIVFLRTQPHPHGKTPFDNNSWLDLDYLSLAYGATVVKSYSVALIFLEISVEPTRREQQRIDPMLVDSSENGTPDGRPRGIPTMPQLLLEVYRNFSDSDGFDGVLASADSDAALDNPTLLLQKYEHEGAWQKIFNMREMQLKSSTSGDRAMGPGSIGTHLGLMQSMDHLGFHHVLDVYIRGLGGELEGATRAEKSELDELHFESMWRNNRWDAADRSQSGQREQHQDQRFHESLFKCLKALRLNEVEESSLDIAVAMTAQLHRLRSSKLDGTTNLYAALRPLTMLVEIEETLFLRKSGSEDDAGRTFAIWEMRMTRLKNEHSFIETESIHACRAAALKCLFSEGQGSQIHSRPFERAAYGHLSSLFLEYGHAARKAGNLQLAQYALSQFHHMNDRNAVSSNMVGGITGDRRQQARAMLQTLKVLWMQGDQSTSVRALKRFIQSTMAGNTTNNDDNSALATLLCQLGKWVAQSRSETPRTVLTNYFEEAAKAAASGSDTEASGSIFYHLARYADAQYQEMLSNDPREQLRELQKHKQAELDSCLSLFNAVTGKDKQSQAMRNSYEAIRRRLLTQIEMDKAEEKDYLAARATFLHKSVESYLRSLESGRTRWDLCVFRLCALWFANLEEPKVNKQIGDYIDRIPSRKFLFLMYQLSARMATNHPQHEKDFQRALSRIILKITTDHPHHSIYQIIALKNGADNKKVRGSGCANANATDASAAASLILSQLRQNPKLGSFISKVDSLCDAYIELAHYRGDKDKKPEMKRLPFDRKWRIAKIGELVGVPVTTVELEVQEPGEYKDFPHIVSFNQQYMLPGGINAPKRIECLASDGKAYGQLVKGNDDMRQDAVLSKIFSILNVLLKKRMETRKRNLGIRTYKVVPLSPRAGLLEWVQNTRPVGEIAVEAHKRYNKGDWPHLECRRKMQDEHGRPDSNSNSKLAVYREIEKHFRPAFRHFCFERFPDPIIWFERRLAYVRSVASNSIAGYVVGLGDRHAQNILVDKLTAEVIHIDLGIAFDQGKLLSTPEVVPFRLTRDIVDGMGITGVEGAFRRCCEETLKVLRAESYIVLTILDVFRYDPLYNWKRSLQDEERRRLANADRHLADQIDARRAQQTDGTPEPADARTGNKEAERALLDVRKKLSSPLSVEYQVNELIQSAMDPRNLCKLFPGWQPW
ncbi:hypothetical protein HK104_007669 [Borealophlyctis nickersoniae]|nr:hypothetical protein HK104_007669 [Borealophlyctis nickersoniae]